MKFTRQDFNTNFIYKVNSLLQFSGVRMIFRKLYCMEIWEHFWKFATLTLVNKLRHYSDSSEEVMTYYTKRSITNGSKQKFVLYLFRAHGCFISWDLALKIHSRIPKMLCKVYVSSWRTLSHRLCL